MGKEGKKERARSYKGVEEGTGGRARERGMVRRSRVGANEVRAEVQVEEQWKGVT